MQEPNETNVITEAPAAAVVESSAVAAPVAPARKNLRIYLLSGLAVLILAVGLLFLLERDGRVSTGLFGDISGGQPVAYVNGEEIPKRDFDSSLSQLLQMAAAQGSDTTNEEVVAGYRTQAIETLVNGELLRQAALEAGVVVAEQAILDRYAEIETGLGGKDQLAARMAEFGITESTLRRDIENEILIQGLFDSSLASDEQPVSEEEVSALYEELGGAEAGLPPLAEVYDQVVEQIKLDRQQDEVGTLLETLRAEATIEILI